MNRRRFLFAAAAGAASLPAGPAVKFVPRTVWCPNFAIPIVLNGGGTSVFSLIEQKMLRYQQNVSKTLAESIYTGGQDHEVTGWRFVIDRRFLAGGTDPKDAAAPPGV